MQNPADTMSLETLWRPYLDSAEETRASMRLDQAWRALQWEIPSLVGRITSGEVDADSVADIIYSATLRILQNAEGLASFTRQVDDFQDAGTYATAATSNDLYFTAAELRRLSPRGLGDAFTIKPGGSCLPTY